jgi:hypothetical protein
LASVTVVSCSAAVHGLCSSALNCYNTVIVSCLTNSSYNIKLVSLWQIYIFKTVNCNLLSSSLAFTPNFCNVSQCFTCCMQIHGPCIMSCRILYCTNKLLQMSLLCSSLGGVAGIMNVWIVNSMLSEDKTIQRFKGAYLQSYIVILSLYKLEKD